VRFADSGNLRNKDLQIQRPGIEFACLNSVGFTLRGHKSLLIGRVVRGFPYFQIKLFSKIWKRCLRVFSLTSANPTKFQPMRSVITAGLSTSTPVRPAPGTIAASGGCRWDKGRRRNAISISAKLDAKMKPGIDTMIKEAKRASKKWFCAN
jgi:hypothetical protein